MRPMGEPLRLIAVGLFVAVVGSGVAAAQAPSEEEAAGSRQVNLTPAEQVSQAATFVGEMDSIKGRITGDLDQAREERDVVKTLCLNDKLTQLEVAMKSSGERKESLDAAAKRGDSDLANHEFTILSVLHERAKQLDADAKQCVGKEIGIVGESSLTMEYDDELPGEDPSEYPTPPPILEPPSCASCVQ